MNVLDVQDAPQIFDVFLQPGDFYFGDQWTRIRTVLGSCVAITMWHPLRRIGGMCHYMLPGKGEPRQDRPLDGKYGDEAIAMFMNEIAAAKAHPSQFQVKLFGGGNMFPNVKRSAEMDIGAKNVEIGRRLLERHGFAVAGEHLAGYGHRNAIFEVWSGDVWIRHQPVLTA